MEYHLRVNGATVVLHENGSSAEELSGLLTARFGASEASNSRAVALEDASTALVFPLNVVAVRPDFVCQSEKLQVLFSWTPETILLGSLKDKGLLSEQEVRTLTPLVQDPYVTAAFEVFREEGDESDLVDTLQRIVAIRLGGSQKPNTPSNRQAADSSDEPKLTGNALLEQLTAALKLEKFPQRELKELCSSMRSKGKLNGDEEAVLIQLINKELPHLQAAYEIYLEESDENALLSSLKRVARHFGLERVVRGQSYARVVLDAFAAGNPMVCGAWDVYVDEHNEDDFRDTLSRCYVRLNGNSVNTADYAHEEEDEEEDATSHLYTNKPSEEKSALRRFILWLHTQGRITAEQGQALMSKVDAGSPVAEEAMRKYLASGRYEPDGDEMLAKVMSILDEDDGTGEEEEQPIRKGLEDTYGDNPEEDEALRESITLFLDDLCEGKHLLERSSVEKLKTLVDAGDQRLLAAFDLFNEERDLEDLVDTLQRLAEKVVIVGGDEEDNGQDYDDFGGDEDDYNMDDLLDIIVDMGLSLYNLELVRDALEIRHPDLEVAIDNFANTHDQEAFKQEILDFCEKQM